MIERISTGPGSDCRNNAETINQLVDAINTLLPVKSGSGFITLRAGPGGLVLDDSALIDSLRRAGIWLPT